MSDIDRGRSDDQRVLAKRRTVDEDSGGDRRSPDVDGVNARAKAKGGAADKGDRSAGRAAGADRPRPAADSDAPLDAGPEAGDA